MGLESYQLGKKGEEIAEEYLRNLGYEILEKNYHSSQGEVDLIAKDQDCLVFVEVKSYSYRSFGSPAGAVGITKKKSIIHAAEAYLYKNNIKDVYSRFDLITIYKKYNGQQIIEHFKDAFYVN
ncbi:MAG: YraN family protein [Candidatus Margulisbacteria bacterium]|nr:YraN family protein [Candidatus Margulisiibacteriota bacterium]